MQQLSALTLQPKHPAFHEHQDLTLAALRSAKTVLKAELPKDELCEQEKRRRDSQDLDSPGSSRKSQKRIFGGVDRIH